MQDPPLRCMSHPQFLKNPAMQRRSSASGGVKPPEAQLRRCIAGSVRDASHFTKISIGYMLWLVQGLCNDEGHYCGQSRVATIRLVAPVEASGITADIASRERDVAIGIISRDGMRGLALNDDSSTTIVGFLNHIASLA